MNRRTILALGAMGIAVLVVTNDFTAFSVALPAMEKTYGADLSTVQWVVNAYALVFGVAIVTGGRLADMFGRRRMFVLGAAIFAGFSLLAAVAPNVGLLIAARAVMGIGGALMWPSILGMTYELVPAEKAGLAGGLIVGAGGLGNAMGPMLGGALTDSVGWRAIFLLNLPIAAIGVVATMLLVPRDKPRTGDRGLDYPGVTTLSVSLVALLLALDLSSDIGWSSALVIGLVVLSAVSGVGFATIERRMGDRALLPGDIMGNRTFVAASGSVLFMSAVFFAILLYIPQFLIEAHGYSPLAAGVALAPMMVVFALVSFVAGPLYNRIGAKYLVVGGAGAMAVGMLYLSFISAQSGFAFLVPGLAVVGVGVGCFYSSITTAGVTALDESHSALAGGIIYMCQVAGGAVGLGINTAIVAGSPGGGANLVSGIATAFLLDTVLAFVATAIAFLAVTRRRSVALRPAA